MKTIFTIFILLFTNSFIFAGNYFGNDSLKTKTYVLNPTVITGTKIEASQSNVSANVSVITYEEIKQSEKSNVLSLIGDQLPGIFVTERGVLGYGASQGAAGGISIRGIGGSPTTGVLVLIDGRPQFMGIFGHPFPDNYTTTNVQRIEIVKGPSSVLYGTNAMGGVVNIITRKTNIESASSNINLTYGSFNTFKGDGSFGYKMGNQDLFVSFNHDETKGHRAFTDFKINSGYLKYGIDLSENFRLSADGNISKFRTYDPGPESAPLVDNWVEIGRGSIGFSFENKFDKFEGGLKVYHNWGQNDVYDGWHSTDKNTNVLLYQNLKLFDANTITLGIDYKNYGGSGENPLSGDFSKMFIEGNNSVNELGFYGLVQQTLFNSLILNAGLRLEHNSVFGNETVPQFGFAYHVNPDFTLKGSIAKGFRSPTVMELYLFPPRNPDLKPERLWNYEIDFIGNIQSNLTFETSLFYCEGSNLIIQEGQYPNVMLMNSGAFIHRGIEFLSRYFPTEDLSLTASYSFIEPGKETANNPKNKFYIGANYSLNNFEFNVNLKQISNIYGDLNSQMPLPNYTLCNAKVSFKPSSMFTVFLSAENIFNAEYQILYDYPMPKATFFTGLKFNY